MNMIVKPPVLSGVPIVDADTHIAERYDLWTSRAPAALKARVPQVKEVDGELCWVIDGDKKMGPAFAVSTIRRDGSKGYGASLTQWKFDEVFEGAYDVKARLDYMDGAGITAQIAYPNLLGFGNQKSMRVDLELRYATTVLYNDAVIEFQEASGGRIYPQALMPWWNLQQTLAEAERCHKAGLRGINIAANPQTHGLPVLADPYWNPLWELCVERDMPVNFHIGGGFETSEWFGVGGWELNDPVKRMAFGSSGMFFNNYQTLSNILLSGMLERYPALKIVSVESGVGWIPYLLECLEYHMVSEHIRFETPLREIFRRQIYGCCWFESRRLAETARDLGVDNILIQTDFPHPVCQYPDSIGFMARAAESFTPEERRKVFGGNAGRIYNLPLEKLVH
jgi:predicted TIM-barrel fold metal-dependent hydrolase